MRGSVYGALLSGHFGTKRDTGLNNPHRPAEEAAVALSTHDRTWAWAVLDHEGDVLLLATGEGAFAEAQEWAARGYPVTEVALDPGD